MAQIGDMLESKYLKQTDVDDAAIGTITNVVRANIGREDGPPEYKWLISFKEFEKPMVLNRTNIEAMFDACDAVDTDECIGHKLVVYVDPNISYQGKRVGGLRLRAVKKKKPIDEPVNPVADMDDDVPF